MKNEIKKVRKIIFLYENGPHSEWEPKSLEGKYAASCICQALNVANDNGGVNALLLGVRSENSITADSIGLIGTPKHIMSLIERALAKVDEALESGKEEKK